MIGVCCVVIAIQMTGRTIGRSAGKTVVGMALSARDADVSSGQRKSGSDAMVEFRSSPLRGRMASLTRSGKACRNVARICGPVKCRQMARRAVLCSSREAAIHVTLLTAHVDVSARKRKARCRVVVEDSPSPLSSRMADGAILRKTRCSMIGICCGLKRRKMATDALSACSAERVARVALQTRDANVGPRQWEARSTMIKLRASPLARCMTNRAILRETRRCMVWIRGVLKRWTMTGNARRTCSCENTTHVTLGTIDADMGSC